MNIEERLGRVQESIRRREPSGGMAAGSLPLVINTNELHHKMTDGLMVQAIQLFSPE